MDDCRSGEPVSGQRARRGVAEHAREGDDIKGLRSGIVLSLALWAMLLTVGALIFT